MDTLAQIIVQETVDENGCLVPSVPVYVVGTGEAVAGNKASDSIVSSVAASVTNGTVLAENSNRKGAAVYNDSASILYLKLGADSSSSSFTIRMMPNSYYEIPFWYTGVVTGTWASATGNALVTEVE